jgi:hypothetical protein
MSAGKRGTGRFKTSGVSSNYGEDARDQLRLRLVGSAAAKSDVIIRTAGSASGRQWS